MLLREGVERAVDQAQPAGLRARFVPEPARTSSTRSPGASAGGRLATTRYGLLVECVTYAAAGMVTTRQFISVAAWHLLERPDLRARFVAGSDDERRRVLQEIIRLDSVAGHLLRTATTDLTLDGADGPIHIPQGTLIDLELGAANTDEPVFDSHPLLLDPDRQIATEAGPSGLAFGAGHHSCPGEYLAFEETDLFLQRFLRSEWTLVGTPTIGWNDVVLAFDISDLVVRRVS